MKKLFSRKQLAIPYAIFMFLFIVLPLVLIVYYAFTDIEGNFTFDNFTKIFTQESNFIVIARSILVGFLNTVFCILIAYPIAYILSNKKYNKNRSNYKANATHSGLTL